ncbi:hypothetical protein Glove_199g110 [Diversispora epigaea]|uniref:Uncharacterized protein n=1 Tax=Diversispora epigaea TaxID=1348612 RepID=A0A397IK99_9GLOM|nr:hypothetical protein Glove_199g110 [Diversispora epigaea]
MPRHFFEAYRQIENNFALDLRNRAFLSELERLTMFSIVDSLDSAPLYIETTSLSFKRRLKSTKIESHILDEASVSTLDFDDMYALHRYKLWMQNAIRKIECAREAAEHYKLLWAVREEMRQINNV